jgi:hypothetical protein
LVDSAITDDATVTNAVLAIPLGILITTWLGITNTLASFDAGIGRTRRRPSENTITADQHSSLCAFCLPHEVTLIAVQIAFLRASRGLLQDAASLVEFEVWRAVWLRVGVLLTPVVDWRASIRTLTINRLCETNPSVPVHVGWTAP